MKYLPVVFALLAAVAGFVAARIWNKASHTGYADYSSLGPEPVAAAASIDAYHRLAAIQGTQRSGRLSKSATFWSAVAALLSLGAGIISFCLLISD